MVPENSLVPTVPNESIRITNHRCLAASALRPNAGATTRAPISSPSKNTKQRTERGGSVRRTGNSACWWPWGDCKAHNSETARLILTYARAQSSTSFRYSLIVAILAACATSYLRVSAAVSSIACRVADFATPSSRHWHRNAARILAPIA